MSYFYVKKNNSLFFLHIVTTINYNNIFNIFIISSAIDYSILTFGAGVGALYLGLGRLWLFLGPGVGVSS